MRRRRCEIGGGGASRAAADGSAKSLSYAHLHQISQGKCSSNTAPRTHLSPLRQPQVQYVVDAAAHENAEVGAVVHARDAAAVANECAEEVATVEGKASYIDLLRHDVNLLV
jgi:hypothetical protein